MSNSSLATYSFTNHSKSNPRVNKTYNPTGAVTKITIHHMAGNLSLSTMKSMMTDKNRRMSCNYAIDSSGKIGLFVPEDKRSWCSSSRENDYQAITIEVANDTLAPNWHVSDKSMTALVNLCVDICQRNGIKVLNYTGDKNGNLTMHCWFAATTCPGPYLKSKFQWIADQVNAKLAQTPTPTDISDNPNDHADWDAAGNDFIVTASKGDREALRKVCAERKLPVKNA